MRHHTFAPRRALAALLLGSALVAGGVGLAPSLALAEGEQGVVTTAGDDAQTQSTVYPVETAEELATAQEQIVASGANEATIMLAADVTNVDFAGVPGVKVTVSSAGDEVYKIDLATKLEGDLVLDNVTLQSTRGTTYACGHLFETTDEFEGALGTLYGGGPEGEDVSGGTDLILRGGAFGEVYGGGKDSNVGGSVYILIDDPDFRAGGTWDEMIRVTNTVNSLYGGGYAKDTRKGCVAGDVTIEVRAGAFGGGYGGGYNGVPDAYESDSDAAREPASVSGTVTMRFGYEGAPAGCVWPGRAMYTYAGSWHSTVGNVRLEVLEGTSMENGGGDRSIFGCGWRDTVRGTVEVTVRGAWMGSSSVYGGGNDSADDSAQNAGPVRVLNEQKAAKAVSITYATDTASKEEQDGGVNAGSRLSIPTVISGDVEVTLESGNIAFIVLDNENFQDSACSIAGDSHIQINGGRVAQVQGYRQEYQSDETEHRTTVSVAGGTPEAPVGIGYFYYFDEVEVAEGANVLVDASTFTQFGGVAQKPFYSTDDLAVEHGSVLTTRNGGQARILSYVYLAGTWNQEYVSGDAMTDDAVPSSADLRIGNSLEVDGGTLVSHGTVHVYNDVECTGGTLVLMQPTIFSMTGSNDREVSFNGTNLYLPIVSAVNEGYPEAADEQIRLACGDALTGTVNVHLFEDVDTWSTDAVIADIHVGTNYINANAALSDLEATLANEGAEAAGYYFERVDDAKKTEAAGDDYDMWQIAICDVALEPVDMVAYTGGESLGGDSFPVTRYRVQLAEGVDAADVVFTVDGETHTLPAETKSGDVVALAWLPDVFTLAESSELGAPGVDEGQTATSDLTAGTYIVTVDATQVTAELADEVADVRFGAGTLTVRDVSEPEAVVAGDKDVAQPVLTDASEVDTSDGVGVAVIAEGTQFFTNGREELGLLGDGEGGAQVSLLFDGLLPGEGGEDTAAVLRARAAADGHELTGENSEFRYLDLVNENDGNAWVSTQDGATIEIYWPIPEGATADDEFSVLHFKGLHREYRGDLEQQVADCDVEEVGCRVEGGNVVFTLTGDQDEGCFSPFALSWSEKGDEPVDPDPGWPVDPDPGDDDDDEPDVPDTPEDPDDPDTPEDPDEPDTPDTPDEPDTPDTPDTPEDPDEPDTPDTPDEPDTPDDPGEPEPAPEPEPSAPEVPYTGEPASMVLLAGAAGAAAVGTAAALRRRS